MQVVERRLTFVRFLAAGVIAAGANFGSRFLFGVWMSFEWAIVCAFLVGLASGFVLMRGFVFDAGTGPIVPQLTRYLLVNAFALLQTFVVTVVLARWLLPAIGVVHGVEAVSHACGIAVPLATSYILHRHATFR